MSRSVPSAIVLANGVWRRTRFCAQFSLCAASKTRRSIFIRPNLHSLPDRYYIRWYRKTLILIFHSQVLGKNTERSLVILVTKTFLPFAIVLAFPNKVAKSQLTWLAYRHLQNTINPDKIWFLDVTVSFDIRWM